jgi:uncharacterized cupredoxin-like copper-binding protein
MNRITALSAATVLPLAIATAACGGGGGGGSAAGAIAVTATDTACTPATTDITAGKVKFAVANKGSKVTEMYVYGDGDKVISEVENIGPGTSRVMTIGNLKAGHYQLACKPGQEGKGIRTDIHVTGQSEGDGMGASNETPTVHQAVVAKDFKYEGMASFHPKAGDVVEFELTNKGDAQHELEIKGPSGNVVGEVAPIDGGKDGKAVITLSKPGRYTYRCGIDGHEGLGMHGSFTVSG